MFAQISRSMDNILVARKAQTAKTSILLKFLSGASNELAKDPAQPYLFGSTSREEDIDLMKKGKENIWEEFSLPLLPLVSSTRSTAVQQATQQYEKGGEKI